MKTRAYLDIETTAELEMTVDSMQIDNAQVIEAKAGDSIGMKSAIG